MAGRRTLVVVVVLAAIGVPAAVLTATCAGRSCASSRPVEDRVPFCPLPATLRDGIVSGFREGRSPDVLAVADGTPIYTDIAGSRTPWPATGTMTDMRVPIVFVGAGVATDAPLPDDATLDRIAPTVSEILGFERPFPGVRSGTRIAGISNGERPALLLLLAWKGTGSFELESRPNEWPFLATLMDRGTGTLDARAGSSPIDPAATLTTIGTGGLPSQHGITGSWVRNDEGRAVEAYAPDAPVQIIATLADDLDHADPATLVGLVAPDERDRGIVGGGWYPGEDPVDVVLGDSATAPLAVEAHLSTGYGADDVADVLGVVLDGSIQAMDRWTREIVTEAERVTAGSALIVVAGTGSAETNRLAVPDEGLVEAVEEAVPGEAPAVAATVAGGLFLDQEVLREEEVTGQVAVEAMLAATAPNGERMLADAFQGFAVSFARYC